jgi:CRP-like cAMP-binding protein
VSLRNLERKTYPAGAMIIKKGDHGSSAYVVDSGEVEISIPTPAGPKVLATLSTGGIFGEMALIDSGIRSADAIAKVETVCFIIPEKTFKEQVDKADPLIRGLLRVLVRNVRETHVKFGSVE